MPKENKSWTFCIDWWYLKGFTSRRNSVQWLQSALKLILQNSCNIMEKQNGILNQVPRKKSTSMQYQCSTLQSGSGPFRILPFLMQNNCSFSSTKHDMHNSTYCSETEASEFCYLEAKADPISNLTRKFASNAPSDIILLPFAWSWSFIVTSLYFCCLYFLKGWNEKDK